MKFHHLRDDRAQVLRLPSAKPRDIAYGIFGL